MFAVPAVFVVFALIAIALFGWWLAMLIDALRTPQGQWEVARQNQLVYVLMMIFLGVIGTIVYVLVARPQLRAVANPGLRP